MRTVGLFGGSFDPPHVAHVAAALRALEHALDEIWLVPVLVHPHRKQLAAYADRVAMCELAIAGLGPRVRVSRVEEELGPCGTLDVLELLEARHPETRWRLVMGDDLLSTASAWRGWHELAVRAPPIVIARMWDVSATTIRAELARGAPNASVTPAVRDYITARQLYA